MKALILVDIQNDFCPGGALAVTDGDQVVEVANAAAAEHDLVVATQDWHPADHQSFAVHHPGKKPGDLISLHGLEQVLWPVHCVIDSKGAQFHPNLSIDQIDRVFRKGTDPTVDSYSGFYDNGNKDKRKSTGLGQYLKQRGVTEVTLLGLATDYCVKYTALDALSEGFSVRLIEAGCRAVNLDPGDGRAALDEMAAAGIAIVS